jgi:hypothetical protein
MKCYFLSWDIAANAALKPALFAALPTKVVPYTIECI